MRRKKEAARNKRKRQEKLYLTIQKTIPKFELAFLKLGSNLSAKLNLALDCFVDIFFSIILYLWRNHANFPVGGAVGKKSCHNVI